MWEIMQAAWSKGGEVRQRREGIRVCVKEQVTTVDNRLTPSLSVVFTKRQGTWDIYLPMPTLIG